MFLRAGHVIASNLPLSQAHLKPYLTLLTDHMLGQERETEF